MEAIEQSNTTIPGGILVDALPYIDHGYDEPGVREAVRFFILKTFLYEPPRYEQDKLKFKINFKLVLIF